MNFNLTSKLIKQGVLLPNTEVEAKFKTKGLTGHEVIERIDRFLIKSMFKKNDEEFIFELSSINEPRIVKVPNINILKIDGMEIKRIAQVFNFKLDGTKKEYKIDPFTGEPIKRGRKSNKIKELMNGQCT